MENNVELVDEMPEEYESLDAWLLNEPDTQFVPKGEYLQILKEQRKQEYEALCKVVDTAAKDNTTTNNNNS